MSTVNPKLERLLDAEEVGKLLRKTPRAIRMLRTRGILSAVTIPGTRGLRFKQATIRALLEQGDLTTVK